jgi:hypothetical protein
LAGRSVTNVLTTSSKLAGGTRCELGSGAYRMIGLGVGELSELLSEDTMRGRNRRSCANDIRENENVEKNCVCWKPLPAREGLKG